MAETSLFSLLGLKANRTFADVFTCSFTALQCTAFTLYLRQNSERHSAGQWHSGGARHTMESRYHSQHRQESIIHRRTGPSGGDRFWETEELCERCCHQANSLPGAYRAGLRNTNAPWHEVFHAISNDVDHYSRRLSEGRNHITLVSTRPRETVMHKVTQHIQVCTWRPQNNSKQSHNCN